MTLSSNLPDGCFCVCSEAEVGSRDRALGAHQPQPHHKVFSNRSIRNTDIPMPGEVYVKKGSELTTASGAQTDGMTRISAITNMSDQICGSGRLQGKHSQVIPSTDVQLVMIAKPHTSSAVHHHGEEGTVPDFCFGTSPRHIP